jgi:hypothetical protein
MVRRGREEGDEPGGTPRGGGGGRRGTNQVVHLEEEEGGGGRTRYVLSSLKRMSSTEPLHSVKVATTSSVAASSTRTEPSRKPTASVSPRLL